MNGARALLHTLVDADVEVCFGNPGTSEMHLVAALDAVPRMRGVLCLFEGVATGAAEAVAAALAPPGRIATLILPADVSWSRGGRPVTPPSPGRPHRFTTAWSSRPRTC